MLQNESSDDDLFDNTFLLFLDALRIVLLPPADQHGHMGGLGPGVAWELRADLSDHGTELLTLYRDRLSPEEHMCVARYIDRLGHLPDHLFEHTGQGFLAPEWTEIRSTTVDVLRVLEHRVRVIYPRFDLDASWFDALVK